MTGISRGLWGWATWLCLAALGCGGRASSGTEAAERPTPVRIIPLREALVLETAGAPPSDTSITFRTGERRVIILRHGPPDNVTFAQLEFTSEAFGADTGREVRVDLRPRRGVYGMDVAATVPFRSGASLAFSYARYFRAPARARAVHRNDMLFEQTLAIAQIRPDGTAALLPSTRPALDFLSAEIPGPGGYVVAAPQ
jgi:hypothetical protein